MSKIDPSEIAEKVWNNYEKSGKTFSHSLSQKMKKMSGTQQKTNLLIPLLIFGTII